MQVKDLHERITIQTETTTQQANGESISSWSDVATVWANAMPESGNEDYSGNQKAASQSYNFVIRDRSDISVTDRVQWNGYTFDIQFIEPLFKYGRNNYQLLKTRFIDNQY